MYGKQKGIHFLSDARLSFSGFRSHTSNTRTDLFLLKPRRQFAGMILFSSPPVLSNIYPLNNTLPICLSRACKQANLRSSALRWQQFLSFSLSLSTKIVVLFLSPARQRMAGPTADLFLRDVYRVHEHHKQANINTHAQTYFDQILQMLRLYGTTIMFGSYLACE